MGGIAGDWLLTVELLDQSVISVTYLKSEKQSIRALSVLRGYFSSFAMIVVHGNSLINKESRKLLCVFRKNPSIGWFTS